MRTIFGSILTALALTAAGHAADLSEVKSFGDNPGNLRLFTYLPDNLAPKAPLVVVVHGCMQDAAGIAAASGWPEVAARHGIALAFPQTSKENEPLGGCFRTWESTHQKRGAGEPGSVASMIETMIREHDLDPAKVFVTGLSGGGHLVNILLAAYPDRFAAGAPMASFPYACASALADLKLCATTGPELSASDWGDKVRAAMPGYKGPWPRVQIWHGGKDPYIWPKGQEMQAAQWTNVHGLGLETNVEIVGQGTIRTLYGDKVETVFIKEMGHAVPNDPGAGERQCGAADPFAADVDICAAHEQAVFFGIVKDAD